MMTRTRLEAPSGYHVYHRRDAGIPTAHVDIGRPWYYEPDDWSSGDVFSPGYRTQREAVDAAWDWVVKNDQPF